MENVNYNFKKKASNPTFKLSTVLISSQKSSFVHVGGTTEWLILKEKWGNGWVFSSNRAFFKF